MGAFDLVTLDLDGTLLPHDTAFAAILRECGLGEQVATSDEAYFAGEQSLEETFWEQWKWVSALSLAQIHRGLRKAHWLPEIADGVHLLKAAGLRVHLLTDQPTTVTDFLGRWDLTHAIASPVAVEDGKQVGIEARFDKWSNLEARLSRLGIDPHRAVHVGNGSNDVPVWQRVGRGLAVFAPSDVAAAADGDLGEPASFIEVADAILALHRGGK